MTAIDSWNAHNAFIADKSEHVRQQTRDKFDRYLRDRSSLCRALGMRSFNLLINKTAPIKLYMHIVACIITPSILPAHQYPNL